MPPDGTTNLPDGFDLDGPWDQGDEFLVEELAAQYGWTDWSDVIAANGSFDDQNVRPGIYFTPADALNEARNVGILDFTRIVWDDEEEVWYLVVDGDSGGGT